MLNLRREKIDVKVIKTLHQRLNDPNTKKLSFDMIEVLESMVPVTVGDIYNRIGFDSVETRSKLLTLFTEKKLSLKVVQLEVVRRKKMSKILNG